MMLLLVTILLGSVASLPTAQECSKVPTVQLREECSTTQLRVETSNPVQQCKDVIVTQCKKKFSHFPHRIFSSSRVLGTTSTLLASGVRAKHPYSKREDAVPVHITNEDAMPAYTTQHQEQGEENCQQVKEKRCQNIPQWKTIPSESCEQKNVTVYVDKCDSSSIGLENNKIPESSPIVGERQAGSGGYLKIVLPFILLIVAAIFLMLWLLSLWMGISFIAAIKVVLEPLRKGLSYGRFA